MRRSFTWLLAAFLVINLGYIGIYSAAAQSGGQFCVRSFEDSNANGVFDPQTEPLLTRGISIDLLNENSVVVASALLDKSPNADSGVVCFQNLSDGQYSVLMSSADFIATSPRMVTRTVSSTALPTVIEFGAQRISSGAAQPVMNNGDETATPPDFSDMTDEQMQSFVLRIVLSTVGAVFVTLVMALIGFAVYMLRMRSAGPRPVVYSNASVQQMDDDFSAFERPLNSEPPITLEDTNEITPPKMD